MDEPKLLTVIKQMNNLSQRTDDEKILVIGYPQGIPIGQASETFSNADMAELLLYIEQLEKAARPPANNSCEEIMIISPSTLS